MLSLFIILLGTPIVMLILQMINIFCEMKYNKTILKSWTILIVLGIMILLATCFDHSSGEGRTMGECWICGKKGSFQMDGSYYCFEHYNDRMSGEFD